MVQRGRLYPLEALLRIGLYTIPHSGTRFVSTFLRKADVDFTQRHVADPKTRPEWRHVLTVRHPYEVYKTFVHRMPDNNDVNFVAMWGHYIWRTQWMDAFYFPLDISQDRRRDLLRRLMMFCGSPMPFEIMDDFEWKSVGASGKPDIDIPPHMIKPLEFAVQWYKHYTVNHGPRFRHSDNLLGELD